MEITVKNIGIRISPRKMRPVLYGLVGEKPEAALNRLRFTNKKAANYIYELLKSGVAAASENDVESDKLRIKSIACNEGPRMRRRRFWSKGVARPIAKRSSHLVLTVTDEVAAPKAKDKEVLAVKKTKKLTTKD